MTCLFQLGYESFDAEERIRTSKGLSTSRFTGPKPVHQPCLPIPALLCLLRIAPSVYRFHPSSVMTLPGFEPGPRFRDDLLFLALISAQDRVSTNFTTEPKHPFNPLTLSRRLVTISFLESKELSLHEDLSLAPLPVWPRTVT